MDLLYLTNNKMARNYRNKKRQAARSYKTNAQSWDEKFYNGIESKEPKKKKLKKKKTKTKQPTKMTVTEGMINSLHYLVSSGLKVGQKITSDEWWELIQRSRVHENA